MRPSQEPDVIISVRVFNSFTPGWTGASYAPWLAAVYRWNDSCRFPYSMGIWLWYFGRAI